MVPRSLRSAVLVGLFLIVLHASFAQQAQKPLTNADVVKMVKAGVPESVVISSIQSSATEFDLNPYALVSLQKAGITKGEMDAMMAAANTTSTPRQTSATAANATPPPANPQAPRLPSVAMIQGAASQDLPVERTQLAQTKAKPSSMSSLSSDSALGVALQGSVSTASIGAANHINSTTGNVAVGQAGGVLSGITAHRKPGLTYVWAIPSVTSANTSPVSLPSFSVDFSAVPGASTDDFEPTIVKLTPAQNSYRLVGATEGKQDASSDAAADWQVYSHFVEDRVPVKVEKIASGKYRLAAAAPLLPGDYGIVLRPVSKTKKFSGGDVARDQGDGMLFDSVWSFVVPPDAKAQ